MRVWLFYNWDIVRSSFWLLPGLMLALGIFTGLGFPWIDRAINIAELLNVHWFASSPDSVSALLSTVITALTTAVSIVFSSTLVVLSLTSQQFGPRLLRTFLEDNLTKLTLGLFLGATVYCLLLLWQTVDAPKDGDFKDQVPILSMLLALVGCIVCLVLLIAFIHNLAQSIQVQNVVRRVSSDLQGAIEAVFPERENTDADSTGPTNDEPTGEIADLPPEIRGLGRGGDRVTSASTGYVRGIDFETLLETAYEQELCLNVLCKAGEFVTEHSEIVLVHHSQGLSDETRKLIQNCFMTGSYRTPRQDVNCSVLELVEIAVRALSPGINDPRTAVTCVNYLSASMADLAARGTTRGTWKDENGQIRIRAPRDSFADVLSTAFDQIRLHARASSFVQQNLLDGLIRIAPNCDRSDDRDALIHQAKLIVESCERSLEEPENLQRIRERREALARLLESPVTSVPAE